MDHIISDPRLRSLDIEVGSFRHPSDNSLRTTPTLEPPKWKEWERREQQKFEIRLSVRDDEAKAGIPIVKCVELEALRSRLGKGVPLNHLQEIQLGDVAARATNGPALERHPDFVVDPEMVRPLDSPFPGDSETL